MPIINSIVTAGLASAAANVYSSTGNTAITTMYLCNATNVPVTLNIFAVVAGPNIAASPTNNILYSNLQISGNDTYVIDTERLLLSQDDSIRANSSLANAIVATISFTSI